VSIISKIGEKLNIHCKEDFRCFVVQFIKFGIIGVSNTAISLGIYYIVVLINKDWYIIGNTLGFIISVLNSYFWNNKYVFNKTEKGHLKPLLKTYVAYGSTFLLSTLLMYIGVTFLGISQFVAPIVLVIVIPLNFIINKFWAFRDQKHGVKEGESK
jgi:putative flippase GtrA